MYNGLIINQLLFNRKIKKNRLIEHLKTSASGMESIIGGNPTVKKLEPVADFFGVSMDIFFEREVSFTKEGNNIGTVNGNGNKVQQGHVNVIQDSQEKEIEHLKIRLEEKERLLEEKERLIQILMNK